MTKREKSTLLGAALGCTVINPEVLADIRDEGSNSWNSKKLNDWYRVAYLEESSVCAFCLHCDCTGSCRN